MLISRARTGGSTIELSDATPLDVAGAGSPGLGTKASRDDHIHALSSPGSLFEKEYDCPVTVNVRDAIFIVNDTNVDRAQAAAFNPQPAIGFVASKPSATKARVQFMGSLTGFVGLTANAVYYLDVNAGQIIISVGGFGVGDIVQQLGTALDSTTLQLDLDRDYTVL
jgi:hypothetical protein